MRLDEILEPEQVMDMALKVLQKTGMFQTITDDGDDGGARLLFNTHVYCHIAFFVLTDDSFRIEVKGNPVYLNRKRITERNFDTIDEVVKFCRSVFEWLEAEYLQQIKDQQRYEASRNS